MKKRGMAGPSGIALLVLVGLGWAGGAAQGQPTSARLSFRTLGFYGTWLDFGDFAFLKFSYAGPADRKRLASYNEQLRQAREAGQRVILGLYTFDRITHSKPVSEYVANTDALLGGLDRSLIYAVCPGEENVTWNHGTEVLNALYDRLTAKWHLPCYQWLSMPYPPQAKVKADGWILDAYGYDYQKFRRHVVKFLLTGKPVVVCVNATAPSGKYAAEKLLPDEPGAAAEAQMRVCREFDVPVFFYAVDRKWGNVHAWLRDTDEGTIRCRRWAMQWIDRAHAMPPTRPRRVGAQFLAARPLEVCGGPDNTFAVSFDFSDTSFADNAGMEGLGNLRWDGAAKKLELVSGPGTASGKTGARARVYWHLTAPLEMEDLSLRVRGSLEGEGASVQAAVGTSLVHWQSKSAVCEHDGRAKPFDLVVHAPADWRGKEAWIAVDLSASAKGPVVLESVEIGGRTLPPAQKVITLHPGAEEGGLYRDDFASPRLFHFAEIEPPLALHWRRGGWYITGRQGGPNRVKLRIHFVSDKPLADAQVRVNALAWTRAHAASIRLALSADGHTPLVSRDTAKLPQDEKYHRFVGTVVLPLAEAKVLRGAREFWLLIEMVNASGVKAGPSNYLNSLEVVGRAEQK